MLDRLEILLQAEAFPITIAYVGTNNSQQFVSQLFYIFWSRIFLMFVGLLTKKKREKTRRQGPP